MSTSASITSPYAPLRPRTDSGHAADWPILMATSSPTTKRLPVRLSLSDPRIQDYLGPTSHGFSHSKAHSPRILPSPALSVASLHSDWKPKAKLQSLVWQEAIPVHPLEVHTELGSEHYLPGDMFPKSVHLPPLQGMDCELAISDSAQRLAVATGRLEPIHMKNLTQTASATSFGFRSTSSAPPTTTVSTKHHHPDTPLRSPSRDGQAILLTSTATASSTVETPHTGFVNLDFYSMYHQDPKSLHLEWDRLRQTRQPPQRQSAGTIPTSTSVASHIPAAKSQGIKKSRGKSTARMSATTASRIRSHPSDISTESFSRPASRQSITESSQSTHGIAMTQAGYWSDRDSNKEAMAWSWGMLHDEPQQPVKRKRSSQKIMDEGGAHDYGDISTSKRVKKSVKTARVKKSAKVKADREIKLENADRASSTSSEGGHGGQRVAFEVETVPELASDIGPISSLESTPLPLVQWKGSPLDISHAPGFAKLHSHEVYVASTLRLTPAVYLSCKQTLISASRGYAKTGKLFRKSDAQKLCKIDVNKTSKLWEVFARFGWLSNIPGNI
ncbi:hypothetical protein BGZ68_005436 [Mortierella alpina]|nr:hypothetical protein BGZ68_005436 [Mortierella alpina]